MVSRLLTELSTMSGTGEVELKLIPGAHTNSLSNAFQAQVVMKRHSLAVSLHISGGRVLNKWWKLWG